MTKPVKLFIQPYAALFFAIIFISFLLSHAAHVQAADNPADSNPRQKAHALTQSLLALSLAYQQAEQHAKDRALEQLHNTAKSRHDFLLGLIKDDPATVLEVSLTAKDKSNMPEEVRDFIEEKVEFEGHLKLLYADYDDSPAELRHYLEGEDNSRISLHFKNPPKGLKTGQQVKANGLFFEADEDNEGTLGAMALESDEGIMTLALGGTGTDGTASQSASLGEQSVAVILVNFQDKSDEPISVDAAHNLVFTQTNDFMLESSFGQNWLAGQTTGWYTLPINQTCIDTEIANAAKQMAAANQVDLSQFSRIIYMFPNNPSCGWSGLGTVGGTQSETWINGRFEVRVVGHELGHNYGLHHAHSLECGSNTTGNNCMSQEYGDKYDIMGMDFAAHYNAYHKEQLGWLSKANADIVEVSTSGQYSLNVYQTASGTRAVKIPKGLDASGNQQWYYIEYRQPVGFDTYLQNYPAITNGVIVRTATDQDIRSSYLYDMTPDSSTYFDWDDASLSQGQTYQDSNAGFTVSVIGMNSNTATLDIVVAGNGGGTGGGGNTDPTPDNQAPVAVNDTAATAVNASIAIAVLSNDYDADNQAITVVSATSPSNGSVSINADGSVTYKPRRKFTGSDTFSYTISDGVDTATATVSISVENTTSGGGSGGGPGGGKGGGKNK